MPQTKRRHLILIFLIVLGCGTFAMLFGQRPGGAPLSPALRNDVKQFTDVYRVVEQNYAETVDPDKAIYDGAIPGMLRVLDPHSTFFDPKAYNQLLDEQRGKYYGVGMIIGPRQDKVVVISPFVGSPAYRAGIRPGDVLLAIDGKTTAGMNTGEVADLVRGPEGSSVRVTVLRQGSAQPLQFTLTRAAIPQHSVDVHFLLRPGVGYVHLAMFNETTVPELQQALKDFGPMHGLVLDLRQDPGGLLEAAVGVAEQFLPTGDVIVSQAGHASPQHIYRVRHGNDTDNYPIVVLVNRGTASAAEIVSGALQDHDRAIIAGENTFGKGLVQTVFPLSDHTALALTTAKYYTPSGRLIQRNYNGVSLYDYFYGRDDHPSKTPKQVRYTDLGRPVYGGEGIVPDVRLHAPKLDDFENRLLERYTFFDFARGYTLDHQVGPQFDVTDQVMREFEQFLTKQQIPFTPADIKRDSDWLKSKLAAEIVTDSSGLQAGLQVQAESDPAVLRALELMPQAQQLQAKAVQLKAATRHEAAQGGVQLPQP